MLTLTNLQVMYDNAVQAVRDVSLRVPQGKIIALLGSNGAGKSTVLKAISNVLYPEKGEMTGGSIHYRNQPLENTHPWQIVRQGIAHVPEGRCLFEPLSVEENLMMGAYMRPAAQAHATLEEIFSLFPDLRVHRQRTAGYLSGGQQQMVAIGRALMGKPRCLLLDEPSLGLAPKIIADIFHTITRLRDDLGMTVLLVEQNAQWALSVADYGYVMEGGRIVLDGESAQLMTNDDIQEFYLGVHGSGQRHSLRTVKHYKRRKRWLS